MTDNDFFDGIEDAQVYGLRQYITPGEYLLRLINCKAASSRKDERFFAAELEVLWSTGEEALPAGETCSYFQKKNWDGSMGRIKGFIAAAWGHDPDEVTRVVANAAVSEDNPLGDNLMFCRARSVETKSGGMATNMEFGVYDESLDPRTTGRSPWKSAGATEVGGQEKEKDKGKKNGEGDEKARPPVDKAKKDAMTKAADLLRAGGKKEGKKGAGAPPVTKDDIPF